MNHIYEIYYLMYKRHKIYSLISFFLLLIISPIFFFLYVIIYLSIGRPTLFKQIRPGFKSKPFTLYKFRTMSFKTDKNGDLLPDMKRLNKFGSFLRSTSLDELPSLFNVLKGDMSFVGPRPLLIEYLKLYDKNQLRRHDVKPGITGMAQINGRNSLPWQKRFELDLWYVDNESLFLDVKIMMQTIKKVLLSEGINQKESITMTKFEGKKNDKK